MTIDTILGTDQNDSLQDTDGRSLFLAGAGDDWIVSASGRDTVNGQAGNDTVFAYSGGSVLRGGAGDDRLTSSDHASDLPSRILGGRGDDMLFASDLSASVEGGLGKDLVSIYVMGSGTASGGAGVDHLNLVFYDAATMQPSDARIVAVLAGSDAGVQIGTGDFLVLQGFESLSITTGAADDYVRGGDRADRMDLGAGSNTALGLGGGDVFAVLAGGLNMIDGGIGRDMLVLRLADPLAVLTFTRTNQGFVDGFGAVYAGIDRVDLTAGAAQDALEGGGGADVLRCGVGNDRAWGFGGQDILRGGLGDDDLQGGGGDDWMVGGQGVDRLTGGAGADSFVFAAPEAGDIVTDFAAGQDVLAFHAADLDPGLDRGSLSPMLLSFGMARGDVAQFVWRTGAGDRLILLFDANGDAAGGEVVLANLWDSTSLAAQDILIL